MKLEIRFYRTPDRKDTDRRTTDENRDPISGARGAHPVGTGVGAVAGGAATGAAVGSVAGPVGTAAGVAGGAIVGGLVGKGVAEAVNPTAEREYWTKNYNREPYYESGRTWDDYEGAYRTGYEGYAEHAGSRSWDQCEADLQRRYDQNKGKSRLSWDQARPAARAAWDRIENNFERYIGYHVVDRDEEVIGRLKTLWTDESGQPAYLGVRTSWFSGKHHVVPAHSAHLDRRRERIRVPFSGDQVKDAPAFDPDAELSDADERQIEEYYARFGHTRPSAMAGAAAQQTTRPAAPTPAAGQVPQPSSGQGAPLATAGAGRAGVGAQAEHAAVKLSEEQLKVGKREVVAGGVRLRKVVRTEIVQQPVQLRREEVVIERVPAHEATGAEARSFEQGEIYIPLRREEPVIEKEARVREEVRVRKDAISEQQTVSGQVRKEDVEIQREGEARERPGSTRR